MLHCDSSPWPMPCKYPKLRYKRPMSSPRGDGGSFPDFLYQLLPPPRLVQEEKLKLKMVTYFVRVDDTLFKVPESFFLQMSPAVQDAIKFHLGKGLTHETPLVFTGHSNDQFKQILSAHSAYPSLDVRSLTLDHLLTIGELSLRYQLKDLAQWFLDAFRTIVAAHDTPLRTASNAMYVRMHTLALAYRSLALTASVQAKWITRMHWGELGPATALLFADRAGARDLLMHACYVFLMSVVPRGHDTSAGRSRFVARAVEDAAGVLNARQRRHVLAGYYSLRTCSRRLRAHALEFDAAPGCHQHALCATAWEARWAAVQDRPCPLPEVDVLGRLMFVQRELAADGLLAELMEPECKAAALGAVARRRDVISRELHHHFDLG